MTNDIPLARSAGIVSFARQMLLVLAGSVSIALSAQVSVPMVPVPMSLQTLAISVIGLSFGAPMAALAVLAYLAQGAMGVPVFAGGGAGLPYMMGPTGGFLLGFVFMAWMTGWMAERGMARGFVRMFVAALVPSMLLFVPGGLWLWAVTPLDLSGALQVGVYPFLLGGLVKSALAALIVAGGWKALGRR